MIHSQSKETIHCTIGIRIWKIVSLCSSYHNSGTTTASCPHDLLELSELWCAKPCHCIPAFCALPTRLCVVANGVGTLCDVCKGIRIFVQKRIDEAKGLAPT